MPRKTITEKRIRLKDWANLNDEVSLEKFIEIRESQGWSRLFLDKKFRKKLKPSIFPCLKKKDLGSIVNFEDLTSVDFIKTIDPLSSQKSSVDRQIMRQLAREAQVISTILQILSYKGVKSGASWFECIYRAFQYGRTGKDPQRRLVLI